MSQLPYPHIIEHFQVTPPVPMHDSSFSEEIFPYVQPEPHLVQLEASSSCTVTGCLGPETEHTWLQSPFQHL